MVLRGGATPGAGVAGIRARSEKPAEPRMNAAASDSLMCVQEPPTRGRLEPATVTTEPTATVTTEPTAAVTAHATTAGPRATRATASEVRFVAPPVEVGVVASHASNEGVKGRQADDQAKDQK